MDIAPQALSSTTTEASRRPLRVLFHLPSADRMLEGASPRWSDVLAFARRAEAAGFDGVTLGEHFLFRLGGGSAEGGWDSWSLLAALAATTERLTLAPFVTCTNFRNPALLAKMADTVDEISSGRLVLGLGAGWLKDEFTAFGFPFDHRVSRFAEAVGIIHTLLRTGQADFAGRYYTVRDCELHPRGPRPQGPPILIGGIRPRMMQLTAQYADIWDTNFRRQAQLPALQGELDAACTECGRDPCAVARSASIVVALHGATNPMGLPAHLSGTPEEIAAGLRAFADVGFSQVVVWLAPMTLRGIEEFAPVLDLIHHGE